jgi:hypothetical protein
MNGSLGHRIACRARRWTRTTGQQLTLAGSLVACLFLASAAPAAASARPVPDGASDLIGRQPESGWSVRSPIGSLVSGTRFDQQPPEILASVSPIDGPYTAGSTVRVDFTRTDSGSGIRWCPHQAILDTTVLGNHSVSFYAIDVAGNVATTAIDYSVVAGPSCPMIAFPTPGGEWV